MLLASDNVPCRGEKQIQKGTVEIHLLLHEAIAELKRGTTERCELQEIQAF